MANNWLGLAAGAAIGWVTTQFGTLLKDVLRRYLLKRVVRCDHHYAPPGP